MKIDTRTDQVVYVEIGEWTYYIDDSTNEQIIEKWKTNEEKIDEVQSDERTIDSVQDDIIQVLKECKLESDSVLNIILSIALSIAEDMDQKTPIKIITDRLPTLKASHEDDKKMTDHNWR